LEWGGGRGGRGGEGLFLSRKNSKLGEGGGEKANLYVFFRGEGTLWSARGKEKERRRKGREGDTSVVRGEQERGLGLVSRERKGVLVIKDLPAGEKEEEGKE